jgi:hypothetical protein
VYLGVQVAQFIKNFEERKGIQPERGARALANRKKSEEPGRKPPGSHIFYGG